MARRPTHAGRGEPLLEDALEQACSVHEGLQRLVQLMPRVMRGLRRAPVVPEEADGRLGPRHRSALALLREEDTTVGSLAVALGLSLPTASGLVADLEAVGFVQRSPDPADRRRTVISLVPERRDCVDRWLEGASRPIARVLERLSPAERGAFVKAMRYLDAELKAREG